MVPTTILRQLASVRWRERGCRFVWGTARLLAIALVLLGLACTADWLIDRWQETPWPLRITLVAVQLSVFVTALVLLVLLPLLGRMSDTAVALQVEERFPQLGHRLISAVQLNQPRANVSGMSPHLIAAVTHEAEAQAARLRFTDVVDRRRLSWSAGVLLPLVLLAALPFVLFPATASALLARQFLFDREVPRSVQLASVTRDVWPSGDEVELRFEATGTGVEPDARGHVRLERDDGSVEQYALTCERSEPGGTSLFVARVPPSSVDFRFRAWLMDGRMRDSSNVRFVARPEIVQLDAWVVLPPWVGLKPDGTRYAEAQPKGDVAGLVGSTVRLVVTTQKPVHQATLELFGAPAGGGPEELQRRLEMRITEDGTIAGAEFELRADESSYRVRLVDEHGFANLQPPRRSLTLLPDEPPIVSFLPEHFAPAGYEGLSDTNEVEGMPVPLGKAIRIAYTGQSPQGLGRAQLRYRVNEGAWQTLPLTEVKAGANVGPFDLRTGAFRNSGADDQVEFHAAESPDPSQVPSRRQGGGRFDFRTAALAELKAGDQVEYYVEVFDRNPDADRPPGRTDPARVKRVVTDEEFVTWVVETLQQESRIRALEDKQRGVFGRKQE